MVPISPINTMKGIAGAYFLTMDRRCPIQEPIIDMKFSKTAIE